MTNPDPTPRCSAQVAGGRAADWRDVPCPNAATTEYDGQPVCQAHREHHEQRERERIAETFFDGVEIERIRAIAGAGGLAALVAALAKLLSFFGDVPAERLAEIDAAGGFKALLTRFGELAVASGGLVNAAQSAMADLPSDSLRRARLVRAITTMREVRDAAKAFQPRA